MKTSISSPTFLLILMAGSLVANGQGIGDNSGTPLFDKGTWLINIYRPLSLSAYTHKHASTDYRYSDFHLNLEDYYFFHKNMGIGFNFDLSRTVSDLSYKQINTSTTFFVNYLQAFDIRGLDFLAKIGVGIGKTKDVNKSFASSDIISNLGKFKVEVGPVFKLFDNQSMLFEPTVGFVFDMASFRDYKETSPEFMVRANLIFNLGYNDFNSDRKTGFADSHLRWAPGVNTFSVSTMFDAKFGGLVQKYRSYTNNYAINSQSFMINYRRFITPGLAIGGWVNISNDYRKSTAISESSYDSKTTDILIGPGATWYPILGHKYLENIFADLNIGIGENIYKINSGKVKAGVFGGYIDAGYDYGISKHLSINPAVGFKIYRYNYPGSVDDYTELGPYFSIGLKASF